jgi:hypothetical protein
MGQNGDKQNSDQDSVSFKRVNDPDSPGTADKGAEAADADLTVEPISPKLSKVQTPSRNAAASVQQTLGTAASQEFASPIAAAALKNMSGAMGANSVLQGALAAQGVLANTAALGSISSAMTEILKNASGLTGANSALQTALAAQGTLAAAGISNSISRAMSEIVRDSVGTAGMQYGIQSALRITDLPYNANTIAALHAVSAGDLTSSTDARFLEGWRDGAKAEKYFKSVSPDEPAESEAPISADQYFSQNEGEIRSLADLHVKIDRLVAKNPGLALVWRGHQDAAWGLHSTLFRTLATTKGESFQQFPSEEQMVDAEKDILRIAREEWRLNDMPAVEVFARLQHFGAPTRLIDVSRSPLVAAWFAVEEGAYDDKDGRLIALATGPVPKEPGTSTPVLSISANDLSLAGGPMWHSYSTLADLRSRGWGTGSNRLVWIPSAYEERISAQNAGFVLDGIPIVSPEVLDYLRSTGGLSLSSRDLLTAGSIYVHTQKTTRRASRSGPAFAPTFTFRIPREVKNEIRTKLESRYSLTRGTIYPDMAALARYVRADFEASRPKSDVS